MDKNEILRRFRSENGEGDEREAEVLHEAWATAGLFACGLSVLLWILFLYFSAPMILRDAVWLFFDGTLAVYNIVSSIRLRKTINVSCAWLFSIRFLSDFVFFVIDLAKLA